MVQCMGDMRAVLEFSTKCPCLVRVVCWGHLCGPELITKLGKWRTLAAL